MHNKKRPLSLKQIFKETKKNILFVLKKFFVLIKMSKIILLVVMVVIVIVVRPTQGGPIFDDRKKPQGNDNEINSMDGNDPMLTCLLNFLGLDYEEEQTEHVIRYCSDTKCLCRIEFKTEKQLGCFTENEKKIFCGNFITTTTTTVKTTISIETTQKSSSITTSSSSTITISINTPAAAAPAAETSTAVSINLIVSLIKNM